MAIRLDDINAYWKSFNLIMIKWNLISLLGLVSTGVIWAFIAKHVFKVKFKFWWLNDTKDGDFGADWWLIEKGLKPSLWSAFRWWFRNHSWNYISQYNPAWNGGEVDLDEHGKPLLMILINSYGDKIYDKDKFKNGVFTWLKAAHGVGELYVAYIVNGKLECRYSKVYKDRFGRLKQFQKGAGGERYRLNKKPMI